MGRVDATSAILYRACNGLRLSGSWGKDWPLWLVDPIPVQPFQCILQHQHLIFRRRTEKYYFSSWSITIFAPIKNKTTISRSAWQVVKRGCGWMIIMEWKRIVIVQCFQLSIFGKFTKVKWIFKLTFCSMENQVYTSYFSFIVKTIQKHRVKVWTIVILWM